MFVRLGRLEYQFRKIRRSIWVGSSLPKPYRKCAYAHGINIVSEISPYLGAINIPANILSGYIFAIMDERIMDGRIYISALISCDKI